MATANPNKSKKSLDFYYHSIKLYTQEAHNLHLSKSPLSDPKIYLVNCNSTSKCKHCETRFFLVKILWSEVWKGGCQLIQILGFLGMYYDAVVVEVKTFLLLALAILWAVHCQCYCHFHTLHCKKKGISWVPIHVYSCQGIATCSLPGPPQCKKCWWGKAFVLDKICPRPPPD